MKVVKNSVVNMEWNADGFVETKKQGFISAVHQYDGVAVAFRDGKIYTHMGDDLEPIGFEDLVSEIKGAVKSKDVDYPYFYEDYLEIYSGKEFSDKALELLHIDASHKEDMLKRLEDLSGYWYVVESSMPM